jgi:DNA-binding NarL/FixJ family response regulator
MPVSAIPHEEGGRQRNGVREDATVTPAAPSTPPALLLIDRRNLTRDCLVAAMQGAGIDPIIAIGDVNEAVPLLEAGRPIRAAFFNLAVDDFQEDSLKAMLTPLRQHLPACPILLLSEHIDSTHAAAAFRQKVQALLSAAMALEVALSAIEFVELGWMLFPDNLLSALIGSGLLSDPAHSAIEAGLTPRQQQVLDQLRGGLSNKAIAIRLDISERTVKAHVKEIIRRFGVNTRTQVVAVLANHRSNATQGDG